MNLSPKNFSKTHLYKQNNITCEVSLYDRFTYETKNAIYDVDRNADTGAISYRKNCIPSAKESIHAEIMGVFDLEE